MAAFHIDSECVNSTDLPYAFDIAGLPISVNGNTICRGKTVTKMLSKATLQKSMIDLMQDIYVEILRFYVSLTQV